MNFTFFAYFTPNTQQDSENDSLTQNTKLKGETMLKWGTYSIILSHFLVLSIVNFQIHILQFMVAFV
ncbi:hypothetical protein RchiOBHm_Chr6g0271201 [Rosa chinensis]|uniref:Uncharacterized protein n=1 Tax=Rosa chinensis TaxID=74649 RepID=A0A2P6PQW1_ROSCH|nr:hypothetical protein RchiOBHm_Chr6g0271201 [Rosa chinensis]